MSILTTPEQRNATIAGLTPLTDAEITRIRVIVSRTLCGLDSDWRPSVDSGLIRIGLLDATDLLDDATIIPAVTLTEFAKDLCADGYFCIPKWEDFATHSTDPFTEHGDCTVCAELSLRDAILSPALPASSDTIALPVSVGCAEADWSHSDPEPFDYLLLDADGAILAHVVSPEAAQRIMAALNQAASIETLCKRTEALFQDMVSCGLFEPDTPKMQAVRRSMAALRGNGGADCADCGNGGSEAAS